MDQDENLSDESCTEINKLYKPKPDTGNADAKVTSAMSEQCLILLSDIFGDPNNTSLCKYNADTISPALQNSLIDVDAQSTSRSTYKHERQFETYPAFFEWIFKKNADDNIFKSQYKVTEQDTVFSDNCCSKDKLQSMDSKSLSSTTHLRPEKKTPFEIIPCNSCPTIPPLPPFPPCPPEPELPPCDPVNLKLQCITGNTNFKLKCTRLPESCDHPDGTYECEIIDEGKYIDHKNLQAPDLVCEPIHAIYNGHSFIIVDKHNSKIAINDRDESNPCEEQENKLKSPPASHIYRNVNNISEKTIVYACHGQKEASDPDQTDFSCSTENKKQLPMYDRLKNSFNENHNRTMNVFKIATNDLACKIMKRGCCDPCQNRRSDTNNFECLDAAKDSFYCFKESIFVTMKTLSKFTRETIDDLVGYEKKCDPEEPPSCRLRKTSGTPEDLITAIKKSTKQIINDLANQNFFEEEKAQDKDTFEKLKLSATNIFRDIQKISQEEFDTVKQVTLLRETCVNLLDRTSRIFCESSGESPEQNEPTTAHGVVEINCDDPNSPRKDNLFTRSLTNIRYAITSLGDKLKEFREAQSSEEDCDFEDDSFGEIENDCTDGDELAENDPSADAIAGSNKSSKFSAFKGKICALFCDQNKNCSYSKEDDKKDSNEE